MANKINEIIGVINDGNVDEELSERVDNLEDNFDSFVETTNENIANLNSYVSEVDATLTTKTQNNEDDIETLNEQVSNLKNDVEQWDLVSYFESSNLFTDGVLDRDIIIKLETHNSNEYPGFENAEYYNYIPKGTEIINDIPITNFKRVSSSNYFITTILISSAALEVNNQSVTLNTTFYNISTNESSVVTPTFDKTIDVPSNNKLLIYTRYMR